MDNLHRKVRMGFTSEMFPAGTHMCYIFNDETERRKLIAKFLQAGLLNNEKVSYFVDNISSEEVIASLTELGLDTQVLERSKQLSIMEAKKAYCSENIFVPEQMLGTLAELYDKGLAEGYSGTRVSGEMTWALSGCPGSERLIEYESSINNLVVTHPITAICQYDANRFDGATLFEVLRVHPMMVVRGQVVRNPYYISRSAS